MCIPATQIDFDKFDTGFNEAPCQKATFAELAGTVHFMNVFRFLREVEGSGFAAFHHGDGALIIHLVVQASPNGVLAAETSFHVFQQVNPGVELVALEG